MPFIVEDGTGLVDANAYISIEFADQYFQERGVTAWTGTSDQKQAYIIRATDYVEGRFAHKFIGSPLTTTQALSFPRREIAGLPVQLKRAVAEYAVRAIAGKLAPDVVTSESGAKVTSYRSKLGPLEEETQYAVSGPGAEIALLKPYPEADMLLRGLLNSSQSVVRA